MEHKWNKGLAGGNLNRIFLFGNNLTVEVTGKIIICPIYSFSLFICRKMAIRTFRVQETKCEKEKIPKELNIDGYHTYWLSGDKEGYSGVGMYSKEKPINVTYGIGTYYTNLPRLM